jgi:PKHD-type hydroxylase
MNSGPWYLKPVVNETWAWCPMFSPEECDKIVEIGTKLIVTKATVGGGGEETVETAVRNNKVSWIPMAGNEWIFTRCTEHVNGINDKFFNFDLQYIEALQFTIYDELSEFYSKHIDTMYKGNTRKLSFSCQLSEPESYDGGELILYTEQSNPPKSKREKGVATFFPSWTLHEVTPITRGKRYSLVGWSVGPKFK